MSWPEGGGLSPGSALEALENFLRLPCLRPIPRDSSLCVRGGPKPQDRFSSPCDFDVHRCNHFPWHHCPILSDRDFAEDTATILISVPLLDTSTDSFGLPGAQEPAFLTHGPWKDPQTTPVSPAHLGEGLGWWEGQPVGHSGPPASLLRVSSCCPGFQAPTVWQHSTQAAPPRAATKPTGTRDCRETGEGVAEEEGPHCFIERFGDQNQGYPAPAAPTLLFPGLPVWGVLGS